MLPIKTKKSPPASLPSDGLTQIESFPAALSQISSDAPEHITKLSDDAQQVWNELLRALPTSSRDARFSMFFEALVRTIIRSRRCGAMTVEEAFVTRNTMCDFRLDPANHKQLFAPCRMNATAESALYGQHDLGVQPG